MNPLLNAFHAEIEGLVTDPDGGSASDTAWKVIDLMEKRLGPVLAAAEEMRKTLAGLDLPEPIDGSAADVAIDAYDAALTKESASGRAP